MDYKHAYLNTLLLLHSAFMLSLLKMTLKGEVLGHAINSHGNYIVVHGKSWKNHGIVFWNICGNPDNCGYKLFRTVYRRIYCRKFLTLSNQMLHYKSKCIRIQVEPSLHAHTKKGQS